MQKAQNNSASIVEKRFEFVIALAIFLPTIIVVLLEVANKSSSEINKAVLSWSAGIGAYLIGYFSFELFKTYLNALTLKIIDYSFLLAVFCYGIAVSYIASVVSVKVYFAQWLHMLILKTSVIVLFLIPFFILVLILKDVVIHFYQFVKHYIKSIKSFNK